MQRMCFFIGNRDAPQELQTELCATVEEAITRYHAVVFVTGGRGRFDAMAAETVKHLRIKYPRIRLCLLLAYHPAERPVLLPAGYDESLYPLEKSVPAKYAITHVNRWMLRHCAVCIAGAILPGTARKMLEYARRRAKKGEMTLVELKGLEKDFDQRNGGGVAVSLVSGDSPPTTCSC